MERYDDQGLRGGHLDLRGRIGGNMHTEKEKHKTLIICSMLVIVMAMYCATQLIMLYDRIELAIELQKIMQMYGRVPPGLQHF